ncbi:uncharacterised protein [Colletotrichum tofieldiae]|nr:uncharacterised protein [Colletotrichum tofieldiae]
MAEQLILKGTLEGHNGWVTSLATSMEKYDYTPFLPVPYSPSSESLTGDVLDRRGGFSNSASDIVFETERAARAARIFGKQNHGR